MGWSRRQILKARLRAAGPILRDLRTLKAWEGLSAEALQQVQQERLADLLAHAYQSVPYYRETLIQCGVISADGAIRLESFQHIPLLDKAILRREFERLKSLDLPQRKWYENTSGGSTGEPVRLIQDRDFHAWVVAAKIQFDEWTGCRLTDRKSVLWGSARDVDGSRDSLRTRIGRWISNEHWLRAFGLSEQDMIDHIHALNAFRPAQLLAYVESVFELARLAERRREKMYSPRAVMTTAGTLYPVMRETIERVFGAPVFNRYGTREVGDVACECDRHEGLHVSAPWQFVEILRPDGSACEPEEDGELVITNLANYAMPLIRYRIGDTARWASEPCSCGRAWPLLERVSGRVCDTFVTPEGISIPGEYFVYLMLRTHSWLRRFQIVQESVDRIDVYLQPIEDRGEENGVQAESIRALVEQAVGPRCAVNLHLVDEIQPSPSGKFLHTISKVGNLEQARK